MKAPGYLTALLFLGLAACTHPVATPPMVAAPMMPSASAPMPVAPVAAPPPPCDALSQGCKPSVPNQMLALKSCSYQMKAPEGWTYAVTPAFTMAQLSDSGAVMVLTSYETGPNPKTETTDRLLAVEGLSSQVGLTVPLKKMVLSGPPQATLKDGGNKVWVKEFPDAMRGASKGTVAVFFMPLKEGKTIAILAFKTDSDPKETATQVDESIKSIVPGLPPPVPPATTAAPGAPAATAAPAAPPATAAPGVPAGWPAPGAHP